MAVTVKVPGKPTEIVHPKGDRITTIDGQLLIYAANLREPIAIYAPTQWARAATSDGAVKGGAE
ncbi:MAG: hypothetical protein NVV70_16930 [Cellulomonas sp.]|nr:hypothetical protein [Cellulomonas sp.]MCR6649731.1 hypothetical protein [Cellulomonas sp.]